MYFMQLEIVEHGRITYINLHNTYTHNKTKKYDIQFSDDTTWFVTVLFYLYSLFVLTLAVILIKLLYTIL